MLVIREATASDAPLIVEMIRELADFERALDQVDITPDDLVRDGFGRNPSFHALVAEWDGQPAAYILYFFAYSTWAGRPSLFVEDLFVRARFRGKGIGTALSKTARNNGNPEWAFCRHPRLTYAPDVPTQR